MEKIRTALQESRAALAKIQQIGSVERAADEITVNFEPGYARELALIDAALAELDKTEHPTPDVKHDGDAVAGEGNLPTAAA